MRDSTFLKGKRRAAMLFVLATHPETFDIISKKNIKLFHGTNANALPSILKHGLNSADVSKKNGDDVVTGETWGDGNRDFVSLTNDLDTAMDYASISAKKTKKIKSSDLSFGVIIGTSEEDVSQMRTCRVDSADPEIGVLDSISVEKIKFLGVHSSKVEFVRKLVNNPNIEVAPIDIEDRFYYMCDDQLMIYQDKKESFMNRNEQKEMPEYGYHDIMGLLKNRIKSKILETMQKISNAFKKQERLGESKYDENGRDK